MPRVKFYGESRLVLQVDQLTIQGRTVKEVIRNIDSLYDVNCRPILKNSIIFVNQVNFLKLKRYKTCLSEDDELVFLSPVAGG